MARQDGRDRTKLGQGILFYGGEGGNKNKNNIVRNKRKMKTQKMTTETNKKDERNTALKIMIR